MAHHHQRRELARRPLEVGVGRGVEEGVGLEPAVGGEGERSGPGEVAGVDLVLPTAADDVDCAARQRDAHDRRRLRGRRRHRHDRPVAVGLHRRERRVGGVDDAVPDDGELAQAVRRPHRGHPAVGEDGVLRQPEDPVRAAVLRLLLHQDPAVAVEVPPAGAVGRPQQAAVGGPPGLGDRLVGPARHQLAVDPQLGAVPRHVGVVPRQPGQMPVRRPAGGGVEVVALGHDLVGHISSWEEHEVVDDLAGVEMTLAHRRHPGPVRAHGQVGVAGAGRGGRHRLAAGSRLQPVHPLVVEVGEPQHAVPHRERPAAVLVDRGPGRVPRRQHLHRPGPAAPGVHRMITCRPRSAGRPSIQ